jgi:hypothetical protein
MADRVLVISWGTPVRGREEQGLEVFDEAIGLFGRWQQEGRIAALDVVLLNPNGDLGGYIELHGSAEQLASIRETDEFRRNTTKAALVVDRLSHIEGVTNDGVAREMELYRESIATIATVA